VNHAEQFDISIKTTKDVDKFKGLEGVGRSTLELFKEFIVTGEMKRLKDLKGED
jgi:DNA polymerase/3'-5' exonuclease PolX